MNTDQLVTSITTTLTTLNDIWNIIGLNDNQKSEYLTILSNKLNNVLTLSIEEQNNIKANLMEQISNIEIKSNNIISQLQLDNSLYILQLDGTLNQQLNNVNTKFNTLEALKNERINKIDAALTTLHLIWNSLGTDYEESFEKMNEDLTLKRLTDIETRINNGRLEMNERTKTVSLRIVELTELISGLCFSADEIAASPLYTKVMAKDVDGLGVSTSTLTELEFKKLELITEKSRRAEKLRDYALRITKLWDRLEISDHERKTFFGQNRGLGEATLLCCERELNRLEIMKSEKLKELIERQRNKLQDLWDECHYGPSDRLKFAAASSLLFTEEILEAHEKEVAKVTLQLITLRPIVQSIERREQILSDKVEFDEMLKNPNRFKVAGWSIKEESFRKVLNKELPRLTQKIHDDLTDYEAQYGAFYFEDQHYRSVVQSEIENVAQSEENARIKQEQNRTKTFSGKAETKFAEPHSPTASSRPSSRPSSAVSQKAPTSAKKTPAKPVLNVANAVTLSKGPRSPENVNRMNINLNASFGDEPKKLTAKGGPSERNVLLM